MTALAPRIVPSERTCPNSPTMFAPRAPSSGAPGSGTVTLNVMQPTAPELRTDGTAVHLVSPMPIAQPAPLVPRKLASATGVRGPGGRPTRGDPGVPVAPVARAPAAMAMRRAGGGGDGAGGGDGETGSGPRALSRHRKASVINLRRAIMSRTDRDTFEIAHSLPPGERAKGGFGGLCRAPAALPCLAHAFPCCAWPHALADEVQASTYVFVRENAIEFNSPAVILGEPRALGGGGWGDSYTSSSGVYKGGYKGHSGGGGGGGHGHGQHGGGEGDGGGGGCCCAYRVRDDARVVYLDDPLLGEGSVREVVPCGGSCRRGVCGSDGNVIRLESSCCLGMCVRARGPLACVPCCLRSCPGALSYDLRVQDAQAAIATIGKARQRAHERVNVIHGAVAAVPP